MRRTWSWRAWLLLVAAVLLLVPAVVLAPAARAGGPPVPGLRQVPQIVTARLGISAGDAIQRVAPGTDRRALERVIPELFEEAAGLGVRVETVSVGRGFWSGDGGLESENDLDLVVTGVRPNLLALGALLGQRWGQSAVYVWEAQAGGEMLTATVPLPSGAAAIREPVYEALVRELPDGWHVRYAGAESLLFVANTGADTDDQFRARIARAQRMLEEAGARTGPPTFGRVTSVELTRATYQQFVDGAIRGKAAWLPRAAPAALAA